MQCTGPDLASDGQGICKKTGNYWDLKTHKFHVMNSKNHASIYDNMYWTNQLATQKEGDICGGCFSPDTNFDCGKCVEGLECVKDPGSALLQDLPSKCRKPSGNIVLCLRILQKISSFWIYLRLSN